MTKPSDEFLELAKQLTHVRQELAELRLSLVAAKVLLAFQINPDQPQDALQAIDTIEADVRKSVPIRPEQQKVANIIDALQKLRKRGASGPDS